MKHPPRRALLLATPALALIAACHSNHEPGPVFVPATYLESEVNDIAPLADYFGVLYPGDFFYIEGDITDIPYDPFDPWNGHDPFDGFAFTAGQPIHVQFRLFIDHPSADLDVILYDPQIDLDVAYFATGYNPEVGAVDVFSGGLDFHLVVESWVGSSGYTMEIEVFPLYPLENEEGGETSAEIPLATISAESAIDPAKTADAATRLEAYREQEADETPLLEITTTEVDPFTEVETQTELETKTSHMLDADG